MAGPAALDLALALHANPHLARGLRQGSFGAHGVAELIRIANSQPDALQAAALRSAADPALLVEAARFFIEQLMLVSECEADPWRVLGVSPGADEAQIREHYRLLASLLHPDRAGDWPPSFADRVNKAWRLLRQPEARQQLLLDAAQVPLGRGEAATRAAALVLRGVPASAASPTPVLVPDAARFRHAPIWLAGLVVLIAAGALLADRWVVRHYAREGGWLGERVEAAAVTGPDLIRPEPRPAQADLEPAREFELVPLAPSRPVLAVPPAPVHEQERPAAVATSAPIPQPSASILTPVPRRRPADARVSDDLAARPVAFPVAQHEDDRGGGAVAPGSVASAQAAPTAPLAARVSDGAVPSAQEDRPDAARSEWTTPLVRGLLEQYRERYRAGDLVGLLQLFALGAHADDGGMPAVAARYGRVFGATRGRELEINGVYWRIDDGRVLGGGRYTEIRRAGRLGTRREASGRIEFEMIADAGQARFLRLVTIEEIGS